MSASPYRDHRQEFFADYFAKATPYAQYLSGSQYAARWHEFEKKISLSGPDAALISSFVRPMNILVLSGVWCGDCARQGPMLNTIAEKNPLISLRFIDNKENPALQDELRVCGAERVPVVVTLTEDFFELGRFGDRHLSVYRRKARTELGPSCEVGFASAAPLDELVEELGEWTNYLERLQLLTRLAPYYRRKYSD